MLAGSPCKLITLAEENSFKKTNCLQIKIFSPNQLGAKRISPDYKFENKYAKIHLIWAGLFSNMHLGFKERCIALLQEGQTLVKDA